ncbi:hypothetical protein MIND_00866300 [Mycena indigotica]|uniref:Alanine dehydrogenase/pyridine nucleotide transhydrogenase N-terminal domain-containing protein n=1 Tax=Mycena indigotica TaxID=2126181 RepID=A0A8H6W148_9AGAR|nr:uncharacterized protein MIND_00866300 [Mycena indigotica]KAF7299176.1 hypothetical protein MIND_00866300 [Mycena indigotica]
MFSRAGRPLTLALRREDPARIWERRTPLTPDAVQRLVSEQGVQVLVQPCDRRVFRDYEYAQAGATIATDISQAHIHLGIKETPLPEVIASAVNNVPKTHLMFSHTAKGQSYNTPLLEKYISKDYPNASNSNLARLIDYEYLTDEEGKRTVGFGWFAGVAGVLESLSAMAHSHLEIGVASPFLYTPRPHTLPSLDRLRAALHEIGKRIATEGTPKQLGPFIIGLTGTGNVTQGCLSILEELPIELISVKNLAPLVNQQDADLRKIYLVHAKPQDYLQSLDGQSYDRSHYYQNPEKYRSTFATNVAPYLTLFLNGVGWAPSYPRLMSNTDLVDALSRAQAIGGARFTNVGDISCDPEGGLEFLTRSSTLSEPFYKTRPNTLPNDLPSVQMMAVDILPASIPYDASQHFSKALSPYLDALITHYQTGAPLSLELQRATIASNGRLAPQHEWLWEANLSPYRAQRNEASSSSAVPETIIRKQKVLLLGSGMVAGPVVETLSQRRDIELVIASNSAQQMHSLVGNHTHIKTELCDTENKALFGRLIAEADLVISLLPAGLHAEIAEMCVEHRKHLVTASYISPAMQSLHQKALDADVLLLNEIGLDPGIDHCSAISLVSQLQSQGKQIRSFISFCGGLPAPDVPIVPLRYKFSWSPRGVLTAALNGARYVLQNKITTIKEKELLPNYFPSLPITNEFALEGLPNRDSLSYLDTYNLGQTGKPNGIQTVLRGTLRYAGFSKLMESFRVLGFLEMNKTIRLKSWSSFLPQCLSLQFPVGRDAWTAVQQAIPNEEEQAALRDALEWLCLLPSAHSRPLPKVLSGDHAPLDLFAHLLSSTLNYLPGERDMVILEHQVVAHTPGRANSDEVHRSSLIAFGNDRATAMAQTVGLPVAIAALNVLDGKVTVRGVAGPTDASVYKPVLAGMEEFGLGMKESVVGVSESIESRLV